MPLFKIQTTTPLTVCEGILSLWLYKRSSSFCLKMNSSSLILNITTHTQIGDSINILPGQHLNFKYDMWS